MKVSTISHFFFLFCLVIGAGLAVWQSCYQLRDLPEVERYVSVDERIPRPKWVEPADQHDDLLGNGATGGGSEGGM